MAILKTALDEEILSKSQKSICRAILKMAQLHEAKSTLDKIDLSLYNAESPQGVTVKELKQQICIYLLEQISQILITTKIPKLKLESEFIPTEKA
jgi:hypothetical protein